MIVILCGVTAALHIGKLPPALPVLQQSLGISLVASLILPSDVAWQLAASEAQPPNPLSATGTIVPMGPFDVLSAPHPFFIAYAVAYALATLAIASRNLAARDL